MSGNLDFSALVPERDTFTDVDGQVYEFASREDFGVVEFAKVNRIQKQMRTIMDRVADVEEVDEDLAARFEDLVGEFAALILPEHPRIREFTLAQKMRIIEWWQARQQIEPEAAASGE